MPEPAQPLPRLRLLGAVGSASAVAAFALQGPGPSYSYALLTPVLAGCGGWLSWRLTSVARTELAALVYAGLLLLPALGLRAILIAVAFDDAAYVDVATPVEGLLVGTSRACGGLGPLLLAGACALLVLWGRHGAPGAGALLGAAAGAAAGQAGTTAALEALGAGDLAAVARWTAGLPLAGLCSILGAGLGWGSLGPCRRDPAVAALAASVGLAGALATTPPLAVIETNLQSGPATLEGAKLPTGAPGLPVAQLPRTHLQLADLPEGFPRKDTADWPCTAQPETWHRRPRATAVVGLPAQATTDLLDEAVSALDGVHVYRIALLGRSETRLPGPLADWLGWPTVPLLLDRPPTDARWAILDRDGVQWVDTAPQPGERANCAVLPGANRTIQEAWDLGRYLLDGGNGARCAALAWVPPAWRPESPPRDPRALSCPGPGQ